MTLTKTYVKDRSFVVYPGQICRILPHTALSEFNARDHGQSEPYKLIVFLSDSDEKYTLKPDPLRHTVLEIVAADLVSEAECEFVDQNNKSRGLNRPKPRVFSYRDAADIISFLNEPQWIQHPTYGTYSYQTGSRTPGTPGIRAWRDIVISCNAGISRSAAVALAYKEIRGRLSYIRGLFLNYSPNHRIYWMMKNFMYHKLENKEDLLLNP